MFNKVRSDNHDAVSQSRTMCALSRRKKKKFRIGIESTITHHVRNPTHPENAAVGDILSNRSYAKIHYTKKILSGVVSQSITPVAFISHLMVLDICRTSFLLFLLPLLFGIDRFPKFYGSLHVHLGIIGFS